MKKYNITQFLTITSLMTITVFSSCEKFLDLNPISSPTEANFYTDEKGLNGAMIGVYNGFQAGGLFGSNLLRLEEVRADNVDDNNPAAGGGVNYQFEAFTETPANSVLSSTWQAFYNVVLNANLVIEKSDGIKMDEVKKNQIKGQAMFLRGLAYFHMVRLWGKVPLITKTQTTDEARKNTRAESAAIYAQIVTDLQFAADNLPPTWPDSERGRATSFAARSLLGKVYLYQRDYAQVISTLGPVVDAIIDGTQIGLEPQPNSFPGNIKTSKDVLFAVQFLSGGVGESAHQNNRYRNQDNSFTIALPQELFEENDNRKALVEPTANGNRPGKFNVPAQNNETSADFPVIRCADVMLMYAEAINEQASIPPEEAFAALNSVRLNAGISALSPASVTSKDAFRDAVYKERRLELALECDRWFDIIRTEQVQDIYPMIPATRYIYPIPQDEIDNITDKTDWQNPGH